MASALALEFPHTELSALGTHLRMERVKLPSLEVFDLAAVRRSTVPTSELGLNCLLGAP